MAKLIPLALALAFSVDLWPQQQDTLLSLNLDEIVVSGNRAIERKSDIPHQIDLILHKQITRLSPQTTADALANSGAVFVQKSQQGGGSPVLRGFEANKVLLVVDGVRMNNAIYRSGHLQNSITTDPNMMERIEVLSGAGSVIYGTDAMGGVISLFTRRPELGDSSLLKAKAKSYLRYASANQGLTAHGNVNLGNNKWASLTGITYSGFGDLRSGARDHPEYPGFGDNLFYVKSFAGQDMLLPNPDPDVQKQSGYQQLDILQKVLFAPSIFNKHTLNFQLSTSSDVPRYDRLQTFSDGKPRFAEWYYGPQERLFLSYEFQKNRDSWWADFVRVTPAIQMVQESRHDRRFGQLEKNSTAEDLKIYSLNFDAYKLFNEHELRYGFELFHNALQSTGSQENILTGERAPTVSRYPDGTYSSGGFYFSHRWEILGQRLILTDGLRFSTVTLDVGFDPAFFESSLAKVHQQSHSQNLHLGFVAAMPAGVRLNVLLSTGFRNPNIDDLGKTFETNGGDMMVPNTGLRPEQVFYREIGLNRKFGKKAFLQFTAFVSTLTDAIVPRYFPLDGQDSIEYRGSSYRTIANTNTGKARVWGFSAFGYWKPSPHWVLRSNLSYTKGKDLAAKVPLDHIPPLFGNASIAYEKGPWSWEAYLLFNGWKNIADYSPSGEDNEIFATPDGTPAWQTWNLKSSWQAGKHLRLQAGIENILDLNYRAFASGINAPGRNFVFSVHFG